MSSTTNLQKVDLDQVALEFWQFMGVSFKYVHAIKLMSDRLPGKSGLGATINSIYGGDNWNLTIEYILKGEEKQHGEGFGIWLATSDLAADIYDHLNEKDQMNGVFGYGVVFQRV